MESIPEDEGFVFEEKKEDQQMEEATAQCIPPP